MVVGRAGQRPYALVAAASIQLAVGAAQPLHSPSAFTSPSTVN